MIKIKNILKIFLINIILISAFINLNSIDAQNNIKVINNFSIINHTSNNYDQLDQYQRNYSNDFNNSYSDYKLFYESSDNYQWGAQSFKPTIPVLTKVNLLIYKTNISCVLILSIRDNLSGNDLVVMSKGSNEIFEKNNLNWIEFDFPDINVIINQTYYIFLKCYSGSIEFEENSSFYSWIYGSETKYNNGNLWLINKINSSNWKSYSAKDFCFETYGCSNRPPENPTIQGPINGFIGEYYEYTFQTIDPDEDKIYYCVEGGNSESEVCMGPFKSGEQAKATLSWQKIGTYNVRVKARDIKGAESEWTALEVKMPIVNHHNNLFYSLEKYKYLTIVNLIWRQIYE